MKKVWAAYDTEWCSPRGRDNQEHLGDWNILDHHNHIRLNTESSKAQSNNKRPEQTFRAVICSNVVELIYLFNSLKGAQGQHPPQNTSTTFYCNIQYPPLPIPREAFLKLWSVTLTLKLLYAAVLKRQTDQPTTDRIFL